ncbi:hypothetical protein [Nocardia sp. NBC_01009]|uniref:hypothetical protein n=1 Tax=Nocardia sp. NBC_01009 TaxID=2975996 RepID=UPI003867EF17|nr:hypothetical protein OHA42_36830 [Nocardia sp. NBC_01009]
MDSTSVTAAETQRYAALSLQWSKFRAARRACQAVEAAARALGAQTPRPAPPSPTE